MRDFDDSDEMRTFMRRRSRSMFLSWRLVYLEGRTRVPQGRRKRLCRGVEADAVGQTGWLGTGRGNRTALDLSPGTAQPWVVITNHTSHFWGDTPPPPHPSHR